MRKSLSSDWVGLARSGPGVMRKRVEACAGVWSPERIAGIPKGRFENGTMSHFAERKRLMLKDQVFNILFSSHCGQDHKQETPLRSHGPFPSPLFQSVESEPLWPRKPRNT